MDSQMTVRRISHYSSDMDILLVGEGDFSFAAALARAFQYAPCLFATSLDSREMLHIKYGKLIMERRLGELDAKGAMTLNGVDLRTLLRNPCLCHLSFDRIVYNFPHSGFLPGVNECTESLIRKHRELMRAFFKNASRLLKLGGEVHVAQHMCHPYSEWRLEEEAAKSGLELRTCRPFKAKAFSGYMSRRGDGDNANGTFARRNPVTFIFFLPKSSSPSRIVPSPLARTLPCHPLPPILRLPPFAHTVPLHSPSPHVERSSRQKKPPPSCKAHFSISIPCPLCITPRPRPPTSCTISFHLSPCVNPSPTPTIKPISPPNPCYRPRLKAAPPLQKPQPSISNPCVNPASTPTINPLSLPNHKSPPPPTPYIIPCPPQHPSHASNIITTPSCPSALLTLRATTQPPIFTSPKRSKTASDASYTKTSSAHQLINSGKQMGSHQDPYKLDRPPTFNSFSRDEYYCRASSDDHNISELDYHIISESSSCTSFLMWIMSCCAIRKV